MSVKAKISFAIAAVLAASGDLEAAESDLDYRRDWTFENGTGDDQADRLWSDTRTLGASATETLDLAGVLADALGQTVTLADVAGLVVKAAVGNTNPVVVGGAGANPWSAPFADPTDKVKVPRGGLFAWLAPKDGGGPVVGGTGDQLLIANGGGGSSVTYEIILLGRSA